MCDVLYRKKLDSLSTMLSKVKIEKSRQIEDLELGKNEIEFYHTSLNIINFV